MATERFITLPSGRELTFPEGTSDDEIYNAYYDALPDDIFGGSGPEEKEQAGFAGALGEGLQTIGGLPEALRYLADPSAETRKALIEDTDPEYKYQDFYDIGEGTALERVGKGGQFFKELLGGSLGQMALPILGGGITGLINPLLGAGVFTTLAAAQYTPEIAGRQARLSQEGVDKGESPIDPDTAKILGSSFASGALDRVTLAAFPRLQSLLGQNGKAAQQKVGEEIVETARSQGMMPALGRLLDSDSFTLGTLRGATIEGGQEVIQNMISRFGAGAELSGPEATREYIASGVGGALLGGPVGALDIAAKKITRVAAEQQGQAEKERGLREERVARNEEIQTGIYVSPVRTDFDNNKVDFTPENLVDLGFNEDVKSFKAADYNPTVAQLIDKSTDDMPETSTVFTSLLDSFEDIEQNILLNKGKSQDIETDRKTQEQLRKMMPGLKGMAKKILDYAKSQKLEVLEKKKDPTTGQKKQIDFQYKDEKDLSSQELYNQTKENLRLARIAANKIADTHTTEIRARKEAEDAKKKANKQKLEDENKTTGTVAADEQAQEKKEVEEIFGFEQEIDPDTGKKSRIDIEAGSPEDAARNFLRDYIKEYNKNEKKRPLNATEVENVFLDRIDNSNLNDSEKEQANELINIEMLERFGFEAFKTKQGANRGFRIPKDKTKAAVKRQDKELFAQLQAKQLESQKLVKSFNTTNSNLKEGLFGSDTEFFDNVFEKLKDLTDEISVDPEKTQNIIDEIKSYGEDLKKARENPDKDGSVETELQKERMAIDNLINEIRQEAENSTLDSNADLKEATNENIENADNPQDTKKATNEVVNESMTDGCTGSKK